MIKSFKIATLFIILFTPIVSGQFNKVNIDLNYGYNIPLAGKYNSTKGVKTVSLFNKFGYQGFETAELSYLLSESKSAGLLFFTSTMSGWRHPSSELYKGSTVKMFLIGPSARMMVRETRLLGGSELFIHAAPVAGRYEIDLLNMVYYVVSPTEETYFPKNEKGMAFGLFADVSLSKPLGRYARLNLQLGMRYLHMKPLLTTDRNLFSIYPQIGFSFGIAKNKTFYIF